MSTDDLPPSSRYSADMRTIGQGAFGRVLLVYDPVLGREVALKELRPVAAPSAETGAVGTPVELAARFVREARLTARLEHPGIVPVHDLGRRPDGSIFYTMKVVRGRTLAEAIAGAADDTSRLDLLDAFVDVCQAVAYAHSRGIIHRDLKPQNVMVGAFGETVLLDWGVARDRGAADVRGVDEGDAVATRMGTVVGTPAYMSPEQARGAPDSVDERSDIWGLGAILCELLTGRRPYEGTDASLILAAVLAGPPIVVTRDRVLASILHKAMALDPADRYADPLALARDVRAWRAGERVDAHPYSRVELLERQLSRHGRRIAVVAVSLALLALAGVAVSARLATEAERARQAEDVAVGQAKAAADRLADVLITNAESAVDAGSGVETLVFGAEALAIREDPRARGAVIVGDSSPLHELERAVPLKGASSQVAWTPTGIHVMEPGRIERFTADGAALPALTGATVNGYVLDVAPDGRRVAATQIGGVAVWDPDRSVDTPIAVLPSPVRPLGMAWVDDDRIAYAEDRGVVSVRSLGQGKELVRWLRQSAPIRALAARPDRQGVLSASNYHDIWQWDPDTARPTVQPEDEKVGAYAMAVSPDSRLLVAVGEVRGGDGRIRLWDLRTGALLARVDAHVGEASLARFSSDGRWLFTAANEGTARLWSVPDLRPMATIRLEEEQTQGGAFSPDSTRIAIVGKTGVLRVWHVEPTGEGALLPRTFEAAPNDVAWSPSARRLAVAGEDRALYVYEDGQERSFPGVLPVPIEGVAWRDDDTAYVGAWGVPGRLIDVRTGDVVGELPDGNGHILSPDRAWLYATDERRSIVSLAPMSGAPSLPVRCEPMAVPASWYPDGSAVLGVARDGGIVEVPAAGGDCRRVSDLKATNLAISPDGARIAVQDGSRMTVYDRAWTELWTYDGIRTAWAMTWSADGARLFAGDYGGRVYVWERTGTLRAVWRGHRNRIWGVALDPAGRRLATVGADRVLRVWLLDSLGEEREAIRARAQATTGLEVVEGKLRARD